MQLGIDVLVNSGFQAIHGLRVGLFTNMSAVDSALIPTFERLVQATVFDLVSVFVPEHGLFGAEADGATIHSHVDQRTGVTIHSLYGERYRPTADLLDGLDVMVCDIQDVGVRYYTFLWSLLEVVEACAECGVRVLILDRPNPLGGTRVMGSPLEARFSSIVGRYNVPIVHGMTIGELVRYANATYQAHPTQIDIILCDGWQRSMTFADMKLSWVMPSPAMASFITNVHYAGACLLEGTTCSEGRGTSAPFELVGAPFITDPFALAETLNQQGLEGVRFRPLGFKPTASKFAGQLCYGVQAHLTDRAAYDPLRTWLSVLITLRHMYAAFAWLPPHQDIYHFDRLIGNETVRHAIDSGQHINAIMAGWAEYAQSFQQSRQAFLLYE